MAGVLVAGFLCNLAVRRVPERLYMTEAELEAERKMLQRDGASAGGPAGGEARGQAAAPPAKSRVAVAAAWLVVMAPLGWGSRRRFERRSACSCNEKENALLPWW